MPLGEKSLAAGLSVSSTTRSRSRWRTEATTGMNMLLPSIIGSFAGTDSLQRCEGAPNSTSASQIQLRRLLQLGQKLPSQETDDTLVELTYPRLRQAKSAAYLVERLAFLIAQVQNRPVAVTEGAYGP
jgi:hypothetical protein